MNILKYGQAKRPSTRLGTNGVGGEQSYEDALAAQEEVEAARARILERIERMRERSVKDGWRETEEGALIPPGYGKLAE